ncbi:unnamed protein product [Trifolium pratense]|uniref:Uncharacterized protein n=1 Tax=Trifolium pratense TaxID=57577 RepID=A0ACB0LXG8_TRIPR|nr:unnamed protein product [Trifolium pratense]
MALDKEKLQEEAVIHRFYRIILSWNCNNLLDESENQRRTNASASKKLVKVKKQYKDVDDYINTYEPLIFEEAKAQIIRGKEEENGAEWKLGVVQSYKESDDFDFLEYICEMNEGESISQNDMLLISKKECVDDNNPHAFALVEEVRRFSESRILRLRLYLAGEYSHLHTNNVKSCPRLFNMRSHIRGTNAQLYSMKMCNLSTIAREYVAIKTISSLLFKDLILNAGGEDFGTEAAGWKIPLPLDKHVKENFNQYQHEAITAGLSSKAFVLIQGPPGTGKTQTILGILSTILHATPTRVQSKSRHWRLASPWLHGINPRDSLMPKDGDDGFFPTTGNELKPEVTTSTRKYRVRVLVCAPSNSALDEIVLRVLSGGGIHDENNRSYTPNIVRIGLKAHHSIKAVSLDELLKKKRASANKSSTDKQSNASAGSHDDSIRAAILDEATIVFSTLSFSGSHIFSKLSRKFDVVIIDEAAQAVEPATLVPLANQCKKVFLVGDPAQLPATVISDIAKNHGYGTSLFERLMQAGYPIKMLKTQYRMHPEIRSFPSREFYDNSLTDGELVKSKTVRDWHKYRCFGPFSFFDIHEGEEAKPTGSGSWINVEEVNFVLFLYQKLVTLFPKLKSSNELAIISPYSQQVKLFQQRFEETFGVSAEQVVDICTVDGCQGREKDVAIFSCVRASEDRGIGFLEDIRRMNVGITRAKSAVLVVGSASTLRRSEQWNKLVESAEERNCLFKVSKPYTSFLSDENLASMQVKTAEPPQATEHDNAVNNGMPIDNVTEQFDRVQADDNDYGDGDADMDYGGYDD